VGLKPKQSRLKPAEEWVEAFLTTGWKPVADEAG
jgi:hypothetical protein